MFVEQRERIAYHMKIFMDMTEREQWLRMNKNSPSIEEYWRYRLGSSAVSVTLSVNELVAHEMNFLASNAERNRADI